MKEVAALISVEPIIKWNAPLIFDRTEPASDVNDRIAIKLAINERWKGSLLADHV